MSVLYCGDPHGQFRHILRVAAELTAIDRKGNATVIVTDELDEQSNHRQRYIDHSGDIS